MTTTALPVEVCAVIPAHNAATTITDCILALQNGTLAPGSIIVFDDASTDDTGAISATLGATVIGNRACPVGPAVGRTRAALTSQASIVVFVDSDVIVDRDGVRRLVDVLQANADVGAAFGSYDAAPRARRFAGRYGNLRHHYIHQTADREATTFWSGFGAVRRSVFAQVGGFDSRYALPSTEDIELGARLRQGGWRVKLVPEALCKHCKDWRLSQLWRTDIKLRAIPWTSLMLENGAIEASLNVSHQERLKALAAMSSLTMLAASLFLPWLVAPAIACAAAYGWLNRDFIGLLYRSGGLPLAAAGGLLHAAYHVYSSICFVGVLILWRLGFLPSRRRVA